MEYSGSGDVTGNIVPVDVTIPPAPTPGSTSGCEASDFASFPAGSVALVQRGTCSFAAKATNAQDAGAAAVIIFNEGQEGRTDVLSGTLGNPGYTIPVLGASYAVGEELAAPETTTVHVTTSTLSETRMTANVIADSRKGRADRTVVVGSHLDSVVEGPGINDNGSGSSQDLEIAESLPKALKNPRNAIRFAFWGAEESGLLGSTYYVESLTPEQRDQIMANLNFDMVGSPNYARLVYDGDGSDNPDLGPGPVGSDVIEGLFNSHFGRKGLAFESTAFDGRSDYGPFIDAGIPAGGLFSGAEGIKSRGAGRQVRRHGRRRLRRLLPPGVRHAREPQPSGVERVLGRCGRRDRRAGAAHRAPDGQRGRGQEDGQGPALQGSPQGEVTRGHPSAPGPGADAVLHSPRAQRKPRLPVELSGVSRLRAEVLYRLQ